MVFCAMDTTMAGPRTPPRPGETSDFGIELARFVADMGERLGANHHQLTWHALDFSRLLRRVKDETGELERAIKRGEPKAIIHEAADVANFCMMIADEARLLISYQEMGKTP